MNVPWFVVVPWRSDLHEYSATRSALSELCGSTELASDSLRSATGDGAIHAEREITEVLRDSGVTLRRDGDFSLVGYCVLAPERHLRPRDDESMAAWATYGWELLAFYPYVVASVVAPVPLANGTDGTIELALYDRSSRLVERRAVPICASWSALGAWAAIGAAAELDDALPRAAAAEALSMLADARRRKR